MHTYSAKMAAGSCRYKCVTITLAALVSAFFVVKFCHTPTDVTSSYRRLASQTPLSVIQKSEAHDHLQQSRQVHVQLENVTLNSRRNISISQPRYSTQDKHNGHDYPRIIVDDQDSSVLRKNRTIVKNKIEVPYPSSSKFSELPLSLPADVINKVEKFVFFIGYPRSGHSIVGSFLDAHPHMVIAHEFMLFKKLRYDLDKEKLLKNKTYLFDSLHHSSVQAAIHGWRNESQDVKSYTLSVDSPWVGKYDGYISVIGDKSGGKTTKMYSWAPEEFIANYQRLKELVGVPIRVIHCVRNPYDMVSTNTLYAVGYNQYGNTFNFVSQFKLKMSRLKKGTSEFLKAQFDQKDMLEKSFELFKHQTRAVVKITELVGEQNVLDIHNIDLVNDPNSTLTEICDFLEVKCSPEYLRSCSEKVFKSTSKSRDMVVWPQRLRDTMDSLIERYTFFHRYSFSSE